MTLGVFKPLFVVAAVLLVSKRAYDLANQTHVFSLATEFVLRVPQKKKKKKRQLTLKKEKSLKYGILGLTNTVSWKFLSKLEDRADSQLLCSKRR